MLRDAEVTMEANPDSLRREDLRLLRRNGVNRISLGMQSANNDILRLIGRRHNFQQVQMAVRNARKSGIENISLDLIYGLPSQSKEDWADTLAKAIELHPTHISCYGLQLEEGTPLYERYHDSPMIPSGDDQADMYLFAVETLRTYGYNQYEISNFSLPGKECRHNLKYWKLQDYVVSDPAQRPALEICGTATSGTWTRISEALPKTATFLRRGKQSATLPVPPNTLCLGCGRRTALIRASTEESTAATGRR